MCPRLGAAIGQAEIKREGWVGAGWPGCHRGLTYQSIITFSRPLVVSVTCGLCKAFITFQLSGGFCFGFVFFHFSPFLLPSDFEINSVTQPFGFLLMPGSRVPSALSPSCFSEAGLELEPFQGATNEVTVKGSRLPSPLKYQAPGFPSTLHSSCAESSESHF